MRLVDSHAHIYLDQFKEDLSQVIDQAKSVGVEAIYMPNIDHTSIEEMLTLADKYPGFCVPMMGLHPCSVKKGFEKELYEVEDYLSKGGFCAVGEMGTDLYWDKTFFEEQKEAFNIQCELALKYNLPIVIHCRESIDETISLTKPFADRGLTGVYHCFTGTLDQAREIIAQGFKLGIGGVATFKNGGLEPVLQNVDLSEMLLETDSPYLAPKPHRGKRNEPAYTRLVADKIADETEIELEKVGEVTSDNTHKLFQR